MPVARSNEIRLLHEDHVSTLATWWKAVLLLPLWFTLLLPILGAILRQLHVDDKVGLAFALTFGCIYFLRDLLRKRAVIDQQKISFGFSRLSFDKIKRASLERNRFKLPNILKITDDQGAIKLFINRLRPEDLETLIDVLQKRAPQCKVDATIDEVLKYRRAQLENDQDSGTSVSIGYHANRGWEDLPKYFVRSLTAWLRVIGPTGAIVLFTPLWVLSTFGLYSLIRDYSSYQENRTLYDTLVSILTPLVNWQGHVMQSTQDFCWQLGSHPAVLLLGSIALFLALIGLSRSLLSANRVTIDEKELSLDRWTYWWSYNTATLQWCDVISVYQSVIHGRSTICFEQMGKTEPLRIGLDAIDSKDSVRLLQAIKRFAPQCNIDPQLLDSLETKNRKSYTQLWLQSLSSAPERKNLEPLKPEDRLDNGRYEVIRRLGVGGQGTAYLGYDLQQVEEKQANMVALKETIIPVFAETVVRQKVIERFLSEAKLLEKLSSEHVVRLIDYFVDDHRAYLVLEHIEGTTLSELVARDGPLAEEMVNDLVDQMCTILKLLHNDNIIHRDFTPDNLILTPGGLLKLIDFNVAQDLSDGSTDTIVGKQSYIPPEQFRGKPCKQSDIFAFGATVYYLLTGQDPEPLSQSSLASDHKSANKNLGQLVRRCTALALDERMASVQAVEAMIAESGSEPSLSISLREVVYD